MPFSQIIPPSPSATESKRLFCASVSLLLSHIQGHHYHLSKFQVAATGTLKRSGQELPNVRDHGQKPGGPHARRSAAKRSYPTSEVGGGEGAAGRRYPTPLSPRPGAAVRRSYPTHLSPRPGAVGGLEQLPHASTPEARGGGREDQPQAMAAQAQEGLEELSHVEGQKGWR